MRSDIALLLAVGMVDAALAGCRENSNAPAVVAVAATAGPQRDAQVPDVQLTFRRDQRDVRRMSLRELSQHAPARIVESEDPYYGKRKRFVAMALNDVLTFAFGTDAEALRQQSFVLRARDGYAVTVQGARLLEGGAYLAFDDADAPGFLPIGPQQVSPAPTYLVWTQTGQANLDTHPRPWQLVTIEIAAFEALYPHTVPTGAPSDGPAQHGFEVFRDHCIKCHAINREGGRVGPELNVPQSIVEYRPLAQIRAYIKDPQQFRYGAMPAHPQLTETDLDGLIAYFTAMATRKHDPDADKGVTP